MSGLKNNLFFIKHNYIIHTLEDIVIPEILEAIDEKRYVSFHTFSVKRRKDAEEPGTENQVIPMQILVSVQTGRRYLAAYIPTRHRFSAFRLDYMKTVKKGSVYEDYEKLKEWFGVNMSRCFGVSFGDRKENGTVDVMKITFYVDEEKESYILERLEREKRCCTLEKNGEHLYTLTADVFDPNELMHWAKTFIGRIVKIEGGSESVLKRFYGDISRMNRMYGGDDDEHIQ